MPIPLEDLEYGHYYVADVAINHGTPIVRAVVSEYQPGNVLMVLTGAGLTGRFDLRTFAHFEVLEEVESMDPKYNTNEMPKPPEPPKAEPAEPNPGEGEPAEPAEPAEAETR